MVISKKSSDLLHIVIPVYNEGDNFPALYKEIKNSIKTPSELIVIYDFDEDTTIPVVKKFQKKDKTIVLHKNNIGRGALNAILSGFDYVKSGPVLVTMADLSDDLSIVDNMVREYQKGASVVCGSRYMKGGKQIGGPLIKRTLSRLAGTSLYWVKRFPTHDVTNNFKLYDKALLDSITIESKGGFEIGMEITVKAFKLKKTIKELPSTWRDRTAGETNFKLLEWLPHYIHWYFYALF
ncbi:MAG TPA: glycosyltransferase [Candidatus Saccharimonadales bacterium]|nr:glycosyltransferase [Candidatus Saccharimonadales bacterium]